MTNLKGKLDRESQTVVNIDVGSHGGVSAVKLECIKTGTARLAQPYKDVRWNLPAVFAPHPDRWTNVFDELGTREQRLDAFTGNLPSICESSAESPQCVVRLEKQTSRGHLSISDTSRCSK